MRLLIGCWVVAGTVASVAGAARAEPDPRWQAAATTHDQIAAVALYREGSAALDAADLELAVAKLKGALAHWDQPAIRFAFATALLRIDRKPEALTELEHSLGAGEQVLGADAFAQGQATRKQLDASLAHVEITCAEPGVAVTLDVGPAMTCPGRVSRHVLPGEHEITATKRASLTYDRPLKLAAGDHLAVTVDPLVPLATRMRVERRWPRWIPLAVGGGGLALVVTGAALLHVAGNTIDDYDRKVAVMCASTGCSGAQVATLDPLRQRADRENAIGIVTLAVGGVAFATGVVLFALDRARIVPVVAPTSGGATAAFAWRF